MGYKTGLQGTPKEKTNKGQTSFSFLYFNSGFCCCCCCCFGVEKDTYSLQKFLYGIEMFKERCTIY